MKRVLLHIHRPLIPLLVGCVSLGEINRASNSPPLPPVPPPFYPLTLQSTLKSIVGERGGPLKVLFAILAEFVCQFCFWPSPPYLFVFLGAPAAADELA